MNPSFRGTAKRGAAFTLMEVMVSVALAAFMVGGIVYGYVQSTRRAEWSAYSLAAQSLAMQRLEQTRAAKWDMLDFPPVDQVVAGNFPVAVDILDIPISKTNIVYATNFTTITTVSANPPLKMIRVDCVWPFINGVVFTNTVATYRAPDQSNQ